MFQAEQGANAVFGKQLQLLKVHAKIFGRLKHFLYYTEHLMMDQIQENQWQTEYSLETSASPEEIWRIFCDVPAWKEWNASIEQIEMHGPFAAGTEFLMTPPGQEPLLTRLIEVRENDVFVDETRVGDLTVLVAHRIEVTATGRTQVTYAIEASGPGCDDIGPSVSADFPDVLKSLVRRAEKASA